MIRSIVSLLKQYKAYRALSLALLVSNIGTAFTSIAIYAELARQGASAFTFSVAFVLGILPGLFTSHLSGWVATALRLSPLLVGLQLVGAGLLLFPAIALQQHQLHFLLLAEFFGSCLSGFLVPVYQLYVRRTFTDPELPIVSSYNTYVFTSEFVFGQVVGTLLYGIVGTIPYLLFDCLTYLLAAVWITSALSKDKFGQTPLATHSTGNRLTWRSLKPVQRRVLLLTPLLSLVCAPSMALLPNHGQSFGFQISVMGISLTPVLLLLLFRSLGQMLGPIVIQFSNFDRLLDRRWLLTSCLGTYLMLYSIMFTTRSLWLSLLCATTAHLASNVVFTLSSYGLQRYFSADEISAATAVNFQLSILATGLSSLIAGWLVPPFSKLQIVLLSLIPLVLFALYLTWQKSPKAAHQEN